MNAAQPPKKIRKGATSCTECRRRKIRCIWLSSESQVCRRCEERGSACVPQVFSSQPAREEGLSSRERISRLEQQVRSLIKVVNTIQEKHGGFLLEDEVFRADTADEGVSDEESDEADGMIANPPNYLATLFNNDVISSEDQPRNTRQRGEALSKVLEDKARESLQRLIPIRDDVETISSFASTWLSLYQALFPTPAVAQSQEDMLARYSIMRTPDVEPTTLATWLVTVAITVQQIPIEDSSVLTGIKNMSHYCQAVSAAVETNIVAHDSLMGSVNGISAALHFMRLQAGRENLKQIWLTLRRVIAIAELIGLPRAVRYTDNLPADIVAADSAQDNSADRKRKAEMWISICTLDRILAMMCNLPIGTAKYHLPYIDMEHDEPKVFMRGYLRNLANHASKIQELEDLRMLGGSDDQVYAEVLKVDRDLIALSSKAPKGWWEESDIADLPSQLLPYWHYYVTLRVHLLLTLQRDDNHRYDYSRFTCMNACQHALRRFLKMRPTLTGGFFLGRMLDLQALTAATILLLSYHGTKSDAGLNFQAQNIGEPSNLIMQVVAVMEHGGKKKSSDFARHAAPTIRSLKVLLEDDGRFQPKDMTLRVPLLGKIHVRRKNDLAPPKAVRSQVNSHGSQDISPSLQNFTSTSSSDTTNFITSVGSHEPGVGNDWTFDPFTWSIEDDRESMFRDALLAEDFSNFESPVNYDNFGFSN